jgi:hypothetical protein
MDESAYEFESEDASGVEGVGIGDGLRDERRIQVFTKLDMDVFNTLCDWCYKFAGDIPTDQSACAELEEIRFLAVGGGR